MSKSKLLLMAVGLVVSGIALFFGGGLWINEFKEIFILQFCGHLLMMTGVLVLFTGLIKIYEIIRYE